jgi:hypothetical protein
MLQSDDAVEPQSVDAVEHYQFKFRPIISNVDVPYDSTFRREVKYFARKTMHEMFGISCHAAGAKDDRYFRLESEGEKIAHCKVNEDSIVNFKINNIKCANVMCQFCDEVPILHNQTSSFCSKFNIFDFTNKLLTF